VVAYGGARNDTYHTAYSDRIDSPQFNRVAPTWRVLLTYYYHLFVFFIKSINSFSSARVRAPLFLYYLLIFS